MIESKLFEIKHYRALLELTKISFSRYVNTKDQQYLDFSKYFGGEAKKLQSEISGGVISNLETGTYVPRVTQNRVVKVKVEGTTYTIPVR